MSRAAIKPIRVAPLFAALGDETRLRIVARLSKEGPLSIVRLTDSTAVSRQAVRKHLEVLESAGIVRGIRSGRENLFQFDPEPIEEITKYLEFVSKQWDEALSKLKAFVED